MSENQMISVPMSQSTNSYEMIHKYPAIAGFWLRFLAFFIDTVLLGLLGLIIGTIFATAFSNLGPYGKFVGLAFTIPYFGIMNSNLSNGQTIGKKICKIAVRNNQNETIGLGRAVIRTTIIALPTIFNGLAIIISDNAIFTWFANVLIFGVGGAILYTMVFNKKARQGLHDLLVGTYVISLGNKSAENLPKTKRVHYIISISWVVAVIILVSVFLIFQPLKNSAFSTNETQQIYKLFSQNENFFSSEISTRTNYLQAGETQKGLIITLWVKGKITQDGVEAVCNEIATTVFENVARINEYDYLTINLTTGYDIGVSKWMSTRNCSGTIQGWKESLN